MGVIATSFGVAAIAAVAVSRLAGHRHSSHRMSLMLLAFWAIANAAPAWVDPGMDMIGFYVAFLTAFYRPHCRWCWGVLAAFAGQMFTHAAFLLDEHSYWRMLTLNVFFAVQLFCVSIPGGIVGLRHCRSRWPRRDRARTVAYPARGAR